MSAPATPTTRVVLEVDGQELTDLYPDVTRVEVELDDDLAALVRIELTVHRDRNGAWTHLDDERLRPWRPVAVHVGIGEGVEPLMSGYLTHAHTVFDIDVERCRLELWGMDRSVALDREQRHLDWPERSDGDIARAIFAEHGLEARVEDPDPARDAVVSTVMQRETDMAFLRRLARRRGYECYVEGDVGHFHPVPAAPEIQPLLAVHFGDRTTVEWLTLAVDALAPAEVGAAVLDRAEKTVISHVADTAATPPLGRSAVPDLLPARVPPARVHRHHDVPVDEPDLRARTQAAADRTRWFVTGEGVLDGERYGTLLRPRQPVTITGIGETHSGVYVVRHVTHTLTPAGHEQHFRVERDGIGLTGDEDFSATSRGLGGSW